MEIKKCLIIDTNVVDNFCYSLLKKMPLLECQISSDAEQAFKYICSGGGVDLIIINATLGEEFLQDFLSHLFISPPVILICEHDVQVRKALEIDGISDILIMPFDRTRLLKALSKALHVKHSETSVSDAGSVFLKRGRVIKRFFFEGIEYVEAYGIYCKIFYKGEKIVVNESISNLEHLLSKSKFRRVHKPVVHYKKSCPYH